MGVKCIMCPHECFLEEGKLGICGVRTFARGTTGSLNYGKATSLALDPIEKKPLARFHPKTKILSYGSYGCNIHCSFCQNNHIAMARADNPPPVRDITPEELIGTALSLKSKGNIGIAHTYNEPYVGWEFLQNAGKLAHENKLLNVVITNGYVSPGIWQESLSFIDALNVDLKCFSEEGYKRIGAPRGLGVVKNSIESAYNAGVHVEVTTLVVPGFSDNEQEFARECQWIASIDPDIPLHISRFFPCYKETHKKPTDMAILDRLFGIAKKNLRHVFIGNV